MRLPGHWTHTSYGSILIAAIGHTPRTILIAAIGHTHLGEELLHELRNQEACKVLITYVNNKSKGEGEGGLIYCILDSTRVLVGTPGTEGAGIAGFET